MRCSRDGNQADNDPDRGAAPRLDPINGEQHAGPLPHQLVSSSPKLAVQGHDRVAFYSAGAATGEPRLCCIGRERLEGQMVWQLISEGIAAQP
jgi:hypothetical protein